MGLTKVNFGYLLVLNDRLQISPREDLSEMQHRYALGNLAHKRHIVLDNQNRHALGIERLDEFAGPERFLRRHACCWLVQKQKLRLQCQRHSDLEPLLLPVRKGAGKLAAVRRQIEKRQQPVFLNTTFGIRKTLLQRDLNILPDRQLLEHARRLHLDAHAALHPRKGPLFGDIDGVEQDRAPGRRIKTDNQLEQRALPGSVRANQTVNLAGIDRQIDVGDSRQSTKALCHTLHIDERHGHVSSGCRRLASAKAGLARRRRALHRSATSLPIPSTKPCGASITVASRRAPISTSAACWL